MSANQQRARERLLAAAAEQFADVGYRRANVADIAAAAGMAKGTLYLYFSSKVELLMACVAQEQLAFLSPLKRAMAQPAAVRLEAYLEAAIRFTVTSPLSAGIIRGDRDLSAAINDAVDVAALTDPDDEIAPLVSLVADTVPDLPVNARELASRVLFVATTMPAHLDSVGQFLGLEVEEFITTYSRILALGVAAIEHQPRPNEPT